MRRIFLISILSFNLILSCSERLKVDVLIENGTIYDGTGNSPFKGSVAIKGEKIMLKLLSKTENPKVIYVKVLL